MYRLLSGVFMGWSLGSNDSANIFGTAVFSKKIRYRTAVLLCAGFVIIGALLEGRAGMHTLSGLVDQTADSAFAASLAAALTVTLMSVLKLPVSTSQAMVGAILGIGILRGQINFSGLTKVVIAWVATPVGTIIATLILYPLVGRFLRVLRLNIFTRDLLLKWGVKQIEIEGNEYDPHLHQAFLTEESDQVRELQIAEELQKGYTIHDRLLRPSLVKVYIPKKEEK